MRPRRVCVLVVTAVAGLAWVAGCGDGSTEPAPYFPEPTTVTVSPATAEFTALDATVQLTAQVRDQNGNVMAGAAVTWASSTATVAAVSASGLVTAARNGMATINATTGSASGSATVTVAQSVNAVVVTPAVDTLLAGETLRLAAEARDTNGHGVAGQHFSWASSDTAVAVVDNAGLVTGIGAGAAEMTATASGITGPAEITVVPPVATSVAVTPETVALTALGQTAQLAAEAHDQHGNAIAQALVTWSSSDVSVASVDPSGLVTAAGNGTATVTAASGEASGTAAVMVAQAIVSLAVEPIGLTAAQAGKQGADTIVVTALDGGGSPVAGASYRWSTDRHSGWVYPAGGVTDALGRLRSTWVAGWPGEGVFSLIVENNSSRVTQEFATLSTTPTNPPNGALTMLFNHGSSASAGYSLDLTPLSEPTGTYYAAIQWDGGYTGLIRGGFRYDRQLQFSVWDAPGFGSAELIDKASDVVCRTFGAEGTGVACELNYPWRVGSAYRFEITEEEMNGGSATTLHVTDLATESSRFVGTIRFARRSRMNGFAMFVEDFAQRAQHCLAREVRSAAIRRPRALLDGAWIALDEGNLSRWLTDPWNPGTPGCANLAVRDHAAGLELVIGGETASDPNGSRYYTIPKD